MTEKRILTALVVVLALSVPAWAQTERVQPVRYGSVFPNGSYQNLLAGPGEPASLDLAGVIGKRPVVLCYWIAGHERSEQTLLRLQTIAREAGPDKVAVISIVAERPGREAPQIVARAQEIGVEVPVLNDVGFKLGQMLTVQSVPNIAVLDAAGRLMLGNGGSLQQQVEYKLDVEGVIRRAVSTGDVGAYGPMPRYYPVVEMVGARCPDFQAAELGNGMRRRWYNMLAQDKVNVLVFWWVDCVHCKKTMPEINDWLKRNPDSRINLISAAQVSNQVEKIKTEEFCNYYEFVFPTLADEERNIAEKFQVTATPTILFVRPDGVIDSVLTEGADFRPVFESKVRELLGES